jgi:superfamily II DNA or RNA helicase
MSARRKSPSAPKRHRVAARNTDADMRESRLSHLRRPLDMEVEVWQARLRRQFGRAQAFGLENIGHEPVFSEFRVSNPQSGNRYRVAIRGVQPGENFCACPDFATNDLGTCKHIEFVLGKLEKKRSGKNTLMRGFHPRYSEIYLRYGAERQVRFRAGIECPPVLAKRAEKLFSGPPAGTLSVAHYLELDNFLTSAQKSGHELRCYEDALTLIAQIRDAKERCRIIEATYPQGAQSAALKKLVKTDLYPYQSEGALFAVRAGRCLIGDEMGLGKTIQAIAATELFARHFGVERALIVCPTSLKHQWQREIARFTGREAQIAVGGRQARMEHYQEPGFCKITNYEKLASDLEFIQAWSPDVVIVDEAQRVKNWNTVAARALKRIESPFAIVLTGTPLENRLEELVSIVQFVDRYRLGALWRLRHEHQTADEGGRVIGYRDLDRIGKTLAPILLRRRKSEVLTQLPARVDNTIFVPMTPQQNAEHQSNAAVVQQIVQRWRRTGFLSDVDQRRLMCALQNMRMSCNSTFLLDGKTDYGTKADELVMLLEDLFERPEAKVVVFSQWLRTHELIARRLKRKRWDHVLFHGGVPGDKRGALVDRFHNDPDCRVFLSTDAGGVGLNLQHAASAVVNMDMPWNPAVLEQRIGRVHRLGQTRGVQVVNFVAEGTIEEGMLSVLAFKQSLFAGVLDGGEREVFLGGSRLTKFMKSVEAVTGVARGVPSAGPSESAPERSSEVTETPMQPQAVDARVAAAAVPTADPRLSPPLPTDTANPWAPLLSAGLKLVEALAAAPRGDGKGQGNGQSATAPPWIETDAQTGRSYLKLPMPEPQALRQLTEAISRLIGNSEAH